MRSRLRHCPESADSAYILLNACSPASWFQAVLAGSTYKARLVAEGNIMAESATTDGIKDEATGEEASTGNLIKLIMTFQFQLIIG